MSGNIGANPLSVSKIARAKAKALVASASLSPKIERFQSYIINEFFA